MYKFIIVMIWNRNLQKRVISNPIAKVLTEQTNEVDWKMIWDINFMIKISDEEFTPLRKIEISQALQTAKLILKEKFKDEFESN